MLPSSKGRQCGIQAYRVKDPKYPILFGELSRVASAEECAYLCTRRAQDPRYPSTAHWCGSSEYDPDFGDCQLFSTNVKHATSTNPKGKQRIYYDLACLDCGDLSCDIPASENLIDNAGFESGLVGPWIAQTISLVPGGEKSKHHAQFHRYGEGHKSILHQDFNVCNDHWYEIVFDYKLSRKNTTFLGFDLEPTVWAQAGNATGIYGSYYDQGSRVGFGLGPAALNETLWRQARFIYKVDNSTNGHGGIDIESNFYLGCTFSIDNVRVFRHEHNPEPENGKLPLLPNGGFETGELAPWKVTSPPGFSHDSLNISSPGLHGSKYAPTMVSHYETIFYFGLGHIPTIPQRYYILQADFFSNERYEPDSVYSGRYATMVSMYLQSQHDSSIASIAYFYVQGHMTVSTPVLALSNLSQVYIVVNPDGSQATGSVTMDNVRLGLVDEKF